jgi:RNA polymerase sigma-B factor
MLEATNARAADSRTRHADDRALRRYAAHRDPRDLEALVERYRPLAWSLARRYAGAGSASLEDAQQVACLGLVKALKRFEPARGYAFSSYAVPTIAGELKRWRRDTGWALHMPRYLQECARTVRTTAAALVRDGNRAPTVPDIADALGWEEEEVVEALSAGEAMTFVALDESTDDGLDAPRVELGALDPGFELAEYRATIECCLCELDEREMDVVRLRFGEDLTYREIGRRLGIPSGESARTLQAAIARLSAAAASSARSALAA